MSTGRLRLSRKRSFQVLPVLVGLAGSLLVAALILDVDPAMAPGARVPGRWTPNPAIAQAVTPPDPALVLAMSGAPLGQAHPLAAGWLASEAPVPGPAPVVAPVVLATVDADPVEAAAPLPPLRPAEDDIGLSPTPNLSPLVAADVPLPVRRPSDLYDRPAPGPVRGPTRVASAGAPAAAPPSAPDARSVFDKLFGISDKPSGPALAYASPEDGVMSHLFGSGAPANPDRQTAVYDISAHTVYLPNGTRLEAHSGLGPLLDDPRSIAAKNRGVTPPSLYDLTLREKLFHGVRAIRLTPVGNNRVFGRVGLLAHTFMLGPNGDSNGCVSFRNYESFLQAFLSGDIRRLQVVAHRV